jgi:hypothetical protein
MLDVRAQNLHHHIHAQITRAVDLAERRGCEWNAGPVREEFGRRASVFFLDYAFDLVDRYWRDAIGERADSADVRLGEQIGATGKHLRYLDETRTQLRDRRDDAFSAACMKRSRPTRRPSEDKPALYVASKRDYEWKHAR